MHALGILKHDPPSFSHFDPATVERQAVVIKEVKLPHASETHEVCYEPVSRCVFVSQMSNSVLVRIPVSATSGLLVDDQDAFLVGEANDRGEGVEGLHNVSLSYRHPGCLWLSLQFSNTLLLVEGATMRVREVVRVPTLLEHPDGGGAPTRVGGPHAIRECPRSGHIWVALKGAVSCHPTAPRPGDGTPGAGGKKVRDALERTCCSAAALAEYMALCDARGYDCPPPDDFAVWRLPPGAYDPDRQDRGGTLYACRGSPPMVAIDWEGHCWCPQDQHPALLRIDAQSGAATQIPVTFPEGVDLKITGPAVAVAPDGDVWCTLLGGHNTLLRVNPKTSATAIYELGGPPWAKVLRLIHLDFAVVDGRRTMYLLASDLLDEAGVNAIVIVQFDQYWKHVVGRRVIPLPTQDCSCHRIAVLQESLQPDDASVVVTEMASSKVLQLKVKHCFYTTPIKEVLSKLGDHDRYTFEDAPEATGHRC